MAKRITKYESVLNKARERMEIARQNVETAESQLGIAQAAFNAHEMAYSALEKELAPTPRKAAKKAAGSPVAQKEQVVKDDSDLLCVANVPTLNVPCQSSKLNLIHDPNGGYAGYHEFEGPKLVARASRKSTKKSEPALSDQSSEIETETAISASSGGD